MFYFPISHQETARQIANLLNTYNGLALQRTARDILSSKTNYVVETHGKFVIGVAGIQKVSHQLSELKHMVVHPNWRGKGLGPFVARRALRICETPSVYATVRTTNKGSIKALEKLEFSGVHEFPAGNHHLIMLVRAAPKCQTTRTTWTSRSRSSPEVTWTDLADEKYLDSYPG
jgi:N-acetylglutamate synthase-like GNAT family acetyltransferase